MSEEKGRWGTDKNEEYPIPTFSCPHSHVGYFLLIPTHRNPFSLMSHHMLWFIQLYATLGCNTTPFLTHEARPCNRDLSLCSCTKTKWKVSFLVCLSRAFLTKNRFLKHPTSLCLMRRCTVYIYWKAEVFKSFLEVKCNFFLNDEIFSLQKQPRRTSAIYSSKFRTSEANLPRIWS